MTPCCGQAGKVKNESDLKFICPSVAPKCAGYDGSKGTFGECYVDVSNRAINQCTRSYGEPTVCCNQQQYWNGWRKYDTIHALAYQCPQETPLCFGYQAELRYSNNAVKRPRIFGYCINATTSLTFEEAIILLTDVGTKNVFTVTVSPRWCCECEGSVFRGPALSPMGVGGSMEHIVQVYTLCRGLGRQVKPVPLPSVQEVNPYLAVLSTFSTADIAKPLPSCTSYHMP